MLCLDHALAFILLTTSLEPADMGSQLAAIKPAFLQLAVAHEILDRHEEQFFNGLSQDLPGDVRVLQQRFQNMRNLPRLAEVERFPVRDIVEDMLAFNRAYRKSLVASMEHNAQYADEYRQAINEVDQCYRVWSLVRDARCQFYYVTARRQSLQQLCNLVGAEAFYRGQLPPHVPIWHFPRLR